MARVYTPEQLLDSVLTKTKITCNRYKTEGAAYECDGHDAVEYFFGQGWRATNNYTYCPECAKKYLKL